LEVGRGQTRRVEALVCYIFLFFFTKFCGWGLVLLSCAVMTGADVSWQNDPGPSGPGHTVSNLEEQYNEVYGWLEQDRWGKV
jgi:hypothetical protein